jgi:hypothetical protein
MESNSKTKNTNVKRLLSFLGVFILGVFVMFLYNKFSDRKKNIAKYTVDSKAQKRFRDGGPVSKPSAKNYTWLYYDYLTSKEPVPANFAKRFVGGAYYTITELENYFSVIKGDNPSIDPGDIRVYFCPLVYPTNTTNPFNRLRVDDKIATTMVFMKPPYNFLSGGKPNIDGNPYCLGAYNWGDLEP